MTRSRYLLIIPLLLALAGWAHAAPILTFGFTDLMATYDDATNVFDVLPGPDTDGDVTRILPLQSTARYNAGFPAATSATLEIHMDISNVTPTSATGDGTFMIRDIDGDVIQGAMSGTWGDLGVFAAFVGTLSNVVFISDGNGVFEGPAGGSFSMDFSAYGQSLNGAVTQLMTGKWFSAGDFVDQNTLVHAALVPEPVTFALALAGLLLGRRR